MTDLNSNPARSDDADLQNQKIEEEKLAIIKDEINKFVSDIVVPAFEDLRNELKNSQREVVLDFSYEDGSCALVVTYKEQVEYEYTMRVKIQQGAPFSYSEIRYRESIDSELVESESFLGPDTEDFSLSSITKEQIVQHFLSDYKKQFHFG